MNIVAAPTSYLASPLGVSDTSMTLQSFEDLKGNPITLSEIGGGEFALVIKQLSQVEVILCNAITQNSDGTCTIGFATDGRNLDPFSPYGGYSSGLTFDAGAEVILTNDPWTMSQFAILSQKTTFSVIPASTAQPVAGTDLVTLSYVQALVLGTLTTIDVTVPGTAGATVAAGNLVYFNEGTGQWDLASASTSATCSDVLLGIAQGAGTTGNPIANGILLQGVDGNQTGLTAGDLYYASNTNGAIAASAGTVSITVGVAKDATHLYFAPNFNVQLTASQSAALVGDTGTPSGSNKFITQQSPFLVPTGSVLPYAGASAPTGYLLCNGAAVSRATYATLFALISTTYGDGDGSTTFNVPDMRANVPAGYKSGDPNFGTLGAEVGEATHVLTQTEMPAHTHTYGSASTVSASGAGISPSAPGSGNTGSTGGGAAHNNVQPSLTLNFIVKT